MNVDDFLNAFINASVPVNKEVESYEIINDSILDNLKYRSSALLTKEAMYRKIDSELVEQLRNKVWDVLDRVSTISKYCIDDLDFDPYVDDSAVMYFDKCNIRLNLYVSNVGDEEDYEEAYLAFKKNGESYLVNDTIANVTKLLNELLR